MKYLLLATLVACAGSTPEVNQPSAAQTANNVSPHDYERDRKAILAMAGKYDVSFRFHETVSLQEDYNIKGPYMSKATELVAVIEDTPNRISLQHILKVGDMVIKHWRQDWVRGDTLAWQFLGRSKWRSSTLKGGEGRWHQMVYQVDDSPRYAGTGVWTHHPDYSVWESEKTWRPLPRREYTKRSDYHVVVAINRHLITPDGWVHEQDNEKLVLDEKGSPKKVLAREIGTNTYKRNDSLDFSEPIAYWKSTSAYWALVRGWWKERLARGGDIEVAATVDEQPMFMHMFTIAAEIQTKERKFDKAALQKEVENRLTAFEITK